MSMRLDDTLVRWYGSQAAAEAVMSGLLGSVDRTLRLINKSLHARQRLLGPLPVAMPGMTAGASFAPTMPQEQPAPPRRSGAKFSEIATLIMCLAKDPKGTTNADAARLCRIPVEHAGGRIAALCKRGHLTRARVDPYAVRYFANPAHAKAWQDAMLEDQQQQKIEAARQRAESPAAPVATAAATVGKAENPGPGKPEAAPDTPEQGSQHVLKAEAATPDATDRDAPAHASPDGGPMGAGQPTAAGPVEAVAGPKLTPVDQPIPRVQKPRGAAIERMRGSDDTRPTPPPVRTKPQQGVAWRSAPAQPEPVAKPPADAEVITPEGVKVTRVESLGYDPRYQVDPKTKHFGAGFAAAKVGFDAETGLPWGAK